MRISTPATQIYPESRFKSRRELGMTRDRTSHSGCLSRVLSDYFGELSLLRNEKRAASIFSLSECVCYRISKVGCPPVRFII